MTNYLLFGVGAVVVVSCVVGTYLRRRAFNRRLSYSSRSDAVPPFSSAHVEVLAVDADRCGFVLPAIANSVASAFLLVRVRSTWLGGLFDPAVEVFAPGFSDVQTLERGGRGRRFINLTRLLSLGLKPGTRVQLQGRHLRIVPDQVELHVSRQGISPEDRVLVISPHPDDAEIGAFGCYTKSHADVVTITTGDGSGMAGPMSMGMELKRKNVARVRSWDSITIPCLNGVPKERVVNLGYPDGRLSDMRQMPDKVISGNFVFGQDLNGVQSLVETPLLRANRECSWHSLVEDLRNILRVVRPTIIVTPHPSLDDHLDHIASTFAVCEALRHEGITQGTFFYTCVHNRRSELWPFGPAKSGVAMIPILPEDGACAEGFVSLVMSQEEQVAKFIAIEAHHNERETVWPVATPNEGAWRRIYQELRSLVHGLGRNPTTYTRRAVRPDEVYLTASFESGIAMTKLAVAGA